MLLRTDLAVLFLLASCCNGFHNCPVRRQETHPSNFRSPFLKVPSDGFNCHFGRLRVLRFGSNDNEDKEDDDGDDEREIWGDLKRKVRYIEKSRLLRCKFVSFPHFGGHSWILMPTSKQPRATNQYITPVITHQIHHLSSENPQHSLTPPLHPPSRLKHYPKQSPCCKRRSRRKS